MSDPVNGKWIEFVFVERKTKTCVYEAQSRTTGSGLGQVKWYGPWRSYAFFPYEGTIFEDDCLKDIQHFIIFMNDEQKAKRTKVVKNGKN